MKRFTVRTLLQRLAAYATLCLAVALLGGCGAKAEAETLVEDYWNALARGDLAGAYALLSSKDKAYINLEMFRTFVRAQPHLQFLRLPSWDGPDAFAETVSADIVTLEVARSSGLATVDVRAPDLDAWLGSAADLTWQASDAQEVVVDQEKRWVQLLRRDVLGAIPSNLRRYTFKLVKEKGVWRVSMPKWRAEAMLLRAQKLAAEPDLEDAREVLEALSALSGLEPDAKAETVIVARRALRTLPYLARVRLNLRGVGDEACDDAVVVRARNVSGLPLQEVTGVVQFLNGKRSLGRQLFRLFEEDGTALEEGESAAFRLCLEPPENWSGEADAWVTWLTFPDEVYKTRFD